MGRFANASEGVGMRLAPPMPVAPEDRNGFGALGYPVPFYRRDAANQHMKDMGITNAELRFSCIERMCAHIERDNPHAAMEETYGIVDATGCYRLLAVLLTANPAATQKDKANE